MAFRHVSMSMKGIGMIKKDPRVFKNLSEVCKIPCKYYSRLLPAIGTDFKRLFRVNDDEL